MKAEAILSIVTTGFLKEEEVLKFMGEQGGNELYIVTDYDVFLGRTNKKDIEIYGSTVPKAIFIQEVRLFKEESEIKITRTKQGFIWRKRVDKESGKTNLYHIDETHKLWGIVTSVEEKHAVLTESRGTTIGIPKKFKDKQEVGLVFRKYIAIQDKDFVTNQPFSYQIIDERLVKYCEFKGGIKHDE